MHAPDNVILTLVTMFNINTNTEPVQGEWEWFCK